MCSGDTLSTLLYALATAYPDRAKYIVYFGDATTPGRAGPPGRVAAIPWPLDNYDRHWRRRAAQSGRVISTRQVREALICRSPERWMRLKEGSPPERGSSNRTASLEPLIPRRHCHARWTRGGPGETEVLVVERQI